MISGQSRSEYLGLLRRLVAGDGPRYEIKGDHMSGTFEFSPKDGYCVAPVTKVHVTGEGTLH